MDEINKQCEGLEAAKPREEGQKVNFACEYFLPDIHKLKNMCAIPKTLPVLVLAGTEDPVGSYTKTVKSLVNCYKKIGMSKVELKIYEGARHELINETNREEIVADIFDWLTQQLEKNKVLKEEADSETGKLELDGLKELLKD